MNHFGAACSPKEFYWAVNDALHAAEATIYDDKHLSMFIEESCVWERLFSYLPEKPEQLLFLDVGCGTGLVGHFASLYCPERVKRMTLLDPSAGMLERVCEKAKCWPFETTVKHGDIYALNGSAQYDVVTINSVLHHVVELESFVKRVQASLKPGGLLLTGQDPRALHKTRSDPILAGRRLRKKTPFWNVRRRIAESNKWRKARWRIMRRVRRVLRRKIPHTPLAMRASATLLENGIITVPMDQSSLYAVTDVHVPGHPMKTAKGIDEADLERWMPEMNLLATHTYRFHDADFVQLTEFQQEEERMWWRKSDAHGTTMALVFLKSA